MANDSIGTARVDIVIDLAQYELAIKRAKNAATGFGEDAEKAFEGQNAAAKRAAKSLLDYVSNLGRTREETKLLRAAGQGVDPTIINAATDAINSYRRGLNEAEAAARTLGAAADLQRQIDMFGMGAAEVRRYEASLLGADSVIMPLVQKLEALENEARQVNEAFSMNAGVDKFIADLRREESQIGKTKAEIMELRAAELGVSQQAAPLIASYKAKEAALGRYNTQLDASKRKLNEYGLSQKQLEFAMRGVPAQITDIFVSLQGGQAPLTVLLQQGGQLKDMFGGIRPAAAALSSQLLKLVNIWSVSAVAVSALAIAAYKGSQELSALNRVAIMTGNNMGVTGARMSAMASTLSETTGSLRSTASEAVRTAAATGQFTAEQLALVSSAALLLKRDAGTAIADTVEQFKKLGKDPVDAIVELNEQQHFLTLATYEQIKSMEEQGRTLEAQTLAMKVYADAVEERTADVIKNLGLLERGWRNISAGAKAAWDAMAGIGRDVGISEQIQSQGEKIVSTLQQINDVTNSTTLSDKNRTEGLRNLRKRLADERAELSKLNRQAVAENIQEQTAAARQTADEVGIELDRLASQGVSKAKQRQDAKDKLEADIKRGADAARLVGDIALAEKIESKRAAALKAIEKKYADPKTSTKGANDAQRAALQAFKDEAEQTNAVIQQNAKNTQQSFQNNTVAASEYYSKMRQYVAEELAANERSLQGQIRYLKASKDSINNRREIGKLEADLAQARARAAGEQQRISEEESTFNKKRKEEMEDYANSLRAVELAQQRNYAAQAAAIGQGSIEAAKTAEITKLYTEQADKLYQLAILRDRDPINAGKYTEQEALLRASTERQVQNVEDGYSRMDEARGSWMNGYTRAFSNYNDDMRNIAGQTENFFSQVTGGVEGMLTDLAINGRTTMTTLTNAIIKDLIRLGTQKMLVWLMQSFGGGGVGPVQREAIPISYNANGGVYNSPSLSAYSGQIHNTPQPFMFAKGAGIFGEAGPEAIMPLTRGSNGKLGVQASGAGGPGEVTVNIYGAPSEPEVKQTQNADGSTSIDVLFGQIDSYLAQGIASGTSRTGLAMKGRYQLKENA